LVTRHPARAAAFLNAIVLLVLTVLFAVDRDLADRLTREDAAVEWLQAVLYAAAGAFAVVSARCRWRAGVSPVAEVLVTAMMAGLIIGEVDLDRLLFGRKIIGTRFLIDARVALGWRALALTVMALPPVVLGLYALRRWHDLLAAVIRACVEPAGRVFIAGVVILGLTELFEKPLGRIPGLPRFMVEETLELVAGVCFAVALHAHWRLRQEKEKASSAAGKRCARPT
jgi:hypothetical protein